MDSFKEFMNDRYIDDGEIDTNGSVKQITEHLIETRYISKEFVNEARLGSLVGGVAGVLAVKAKSQLTKVKAGDDTNKKIEALGEMLLTSIYGSMMAAAVAGKNSNVLKKIKSLGGGKRK
tara:strand:+ start:570 stop:929 length:360 start_codon:yes stop_codon:yes gene_type:complete